MTRILWSRVCLFINAVLFCSGAIVTITFISILLTSYNNFPQSDIWTRSQCRIDDYRVINDTTGFYLMFQVETEKAGQQNLCASSNMNSALSKDQIDKRIELYRNKTIDCFVPPVPVEFDQCSSHSPIGQMTLLQAGDETVKSMVFNHAVFYWLAWVFGALSIGCLVCSCYSYWFYWCGCNEDRYWCCGRKRSGSYHQLINDFLGEDSDDISDLDRVGIVDNGGSIGTAKDPLADLRV